LWRLQQQLGCLADDAHALGRKLRLWNTDDNRATWSAELDAGVDYINTDDLAGLDAFLDAP
jgi:glycerophosphoryl diester phosphodiesterase